MKTKLFTSLLAIMANIGVLLAAYQDDATVIFSESFSSSQGQFTIENKQLPSALSYVWKWRSAEYGMVASAYTSGTSYATESWLISPSISLSNCTSATLSFDHAVNKGEPTNFKVKISTDNGSSWSDLSISQWPAGSNWTFINATASLDAYSGQNIKIAFCYTTTTTLCPQWEIKNFCVKANSTNSPSFVGFEANNRLGEQIYSEGLIRDRVNVTLEETDTDVHKYNINLINGGEGTFTMGGITFSFTHTEAGKIAYKTYNTYIQPNGVDREIRIPTVAGAQINVVLIDACAGMLVNGVSMDFAAGDNIITASGSSVILRNPTNKPKISAILPFVGETTDPDPDSTQVSGRVQVGDLYYNLYATNQTAEVTYQVEQWENNYSDLTFASIPASITYNEATYSVTSIGRRAFIGCSSITSIEIPNSVTRIGNEAFYGCSGLTSVTIGNSVTSIGSSAFAYCSGLTSVTIPNSVTSIADGTFSSCTGLTSVTIPNSVTSIGESAFSGCTGLTFVTIGNNVTSIGESAFAGCTGLTSVTIPNSVTSIGSKTFRNCSGLTSVIWSAKNCADFISNNTPFYGLRSQITSFTFGNEVEYIPASLCNGMSNLTSVTIPNSVTSIGDYAFRGCSSLTSVTIGNSVTSIGGGAFSLCSGLTSVIVIWNAKNCADFKSNNTPFYGLRSQITSFTFGNEVEYIPASLCNGMSNLTSVTIPNSVTSIGEAAFYGCSGLTSVTIGNSVTSIGSSAFDGCTGLTSVTIPNSVTSIGEAAFYGCSGLTSVIWNAKNCADFKSSNTPFYGLRSQITSFTFGNEVEYIPASLCNGMSNLTSVTIPNSVTSIGESAFSGCTGLTFVTIGNNVTSIGESAFAGCTGLTSVTIPNSVTSIGSKTFRNCSGLTSVTIGNSVTSIGSNAFQSCSSLTSVEIPNSVTSIGSSAFYGCSGLTSVTIGNSVTSIGSNAFYGCSGLTSIEIPNSVTSIGDDAFSGCRSLTSVTISNSVTSIGVGTFEWCSSLTSVEIPNSVTSIGGSAFYGCSGLTSIEIPNSVTSIGGSAFYGCSGLTSIEIPNSVTSIGYRAFYNCSGLKSVTINSNDILSKDYSSESNISNIFGIQVTNYVIGNSVKRIGSNAFWHCDSLTTVSIGNSVTSIGSSAFSRCSSLTSVHISDIAAWCSIEFADSFANPLWYAHHLYLNNELVTDLVIPGYITSIGDYAFYYCSDLTSITIQKGCESVGDNAFGGCSKVKTITLPSTLTYIGKYAFDTEGVLDVYDYATTPQDMSINNEYTGYELSLLRGVLATARLHVPQQSISLYKEAYFWCYFGSFIPLETPEPEAIDQVYYGDNSPQHANGNKILRDGQILILRGDHTYTITGQEVR